jgi:hypothetical protein
MRQRVPHPATSRELLRVLKIPRDERTIFKRNLRNLVNDGALHAPLRPNIPALRPGATYLLETVVRTLKVGHPFSQGTADSNEIWLDVTATSGGRIIGRNGALDAGSVDPNAHFISVYMLDRHGRRVDRRNVQDIFVPLYDHQIPPSAAAVVHYGLHGTGGRQRRSRSR